MAVLGGMGLQQLGRHPRTGAGCQLRTLCQPARHSCAAFCVCASTGVAHTKDVARSPHLGQSLTDHNGSAGGTAAAPSSRSQQAGPLSAVATLDAEVLAGQPSSGRKPPWNKGRSIPEETRAKISLAQKRRWKKNPGLRATIGAKMQGKAPWNKGLKMSDETRAKMSAARMHSTHLRSTRKKMSRAHTGMRHTPATLEALSAAQSGRPKSDDHRQAIAAAQRRRHAACRVLRAIEEVHGATAEAPRFDASRFRNSNPGSSSSGLKGVKGSKPPTRTQVLATYRNQLREYRALQEELTPWTAAFQQRHGRKPRLADVEHTGVEWLIAKYKCYMMMRERLVMDTPQLRDKLTSAKPGAAEAMTSRDDMSGASSSTLSSGAARFAAAMEHKRTQASRLVPPPDLAAVAAGSMTAPGSAQQPGDLPSTAHASVAPWSSAAPAADTAVVNGNAGGSSLHPAARQPNPVAAIDGDMPVDGAQPPTLADGPAGEDPGVAALTQQQPASPRLRTLQAAPANAPQRVRSAMSAALQYRAKKAADAAAAANTAATAAALPPAARRSRSGAAQPAGQPPSDAAGRT